MKRKYKITGVFSGDYFLNCPDNSGDVSRRVISFGNFPQNVVLGGYPMCDLMGKKVTIRFESGNKLSFLSGMHGAGHSDIGGIELSREHINNMRIEIHQ